jgi:hypothetical protein
MSIYGRNESQSEGNLVRFAHRSAEPVIVHCAIVVEEFTKFEVERLGTGRSTTAQNSPEGWVEAKSAWDSLTSIIVG